MSILYSMSNTISIVACWACQRKCLIQFLNIEEHLYQHITGQSGTRNRISLCLPCPQH